MSVTPYQEPSLAYSEESEQSLSSSRPQHAASQLEQDAGTVMEVALSAFAGAIAGGITGMGIDIFGWRNGALLGGVVGAFFGGTGVAAEKLHVSHSIKLTSSLAAGGLLAGTTGMLLTNSGVVAVSEAVGAGIGASLFALLLKENDEANIGMIIGGAALAGALAGACEATKALGGALLFGSVVLLAKAAKIGFGKVSLWDAKEGVVLGAFLGQVLETTETLGASATWTIIEEASLAGAGLGAVVGAVYVEKCRQDSIAKSEMRDTSATPIYAAIGIGTAAAVGGYVAKLTSRYVFPIFL